jgi:antitoxin component YwqK of YwqJK toxin-antitoxin module
MKRLKKYLTIQVVTIFMLLLSFPNSVSGQVSGLTYMLNPFSTYQYSLITDTIKTFDDLGNKNGDWYYYDEYRHLIRKETYLHGKLSDFTFDYHYLLNPRKRVIESKTPYKDGKINGLYTSYYKNGKIECEWSVRNDTLHGLMIHYYENGNINALFYVIKQLRDGLTKIFYKNGKLQSEIWFDMNKKGIQYDYDKKTRINKITYWIDFQIKEKELSYDKKGVLVKEIIYDGKDGNNVKETINY